ncbi:Hypp4638 [Branchiostoma lanceolatum]|uniref:Hypp4638 protein n=1 Tax=Branchiostoma lanceolatum TaxID=7740 RepID=A0A8K0EWF6_BRALA|nr:Hypp4638 [Branchiostoma lanceolatum]
MGVDLGTYRARIGGFCNGGYDSCWREASNLLVWAAISQLMLKLAGDVEENPGPAGWWSWLWSWWSGDTDAEEKQPSSRLARSKSRRKRRSNQSNNTSTAQRDAGRKRLHRTPPRLEDDVCIEDAVKEKAVEPQGESQNSEDWLSSWQVEDVTNWMRRIGLKNDDIKTQLRPAKWVNGCIHADQWYAGKDPPRFVLDVWGTYTERLRRLVLNIRNTMDYLSEMQTIYKEDDEIAIYDSEFRKLQLAKRKLQMYIELYIKYFGEFDEKPPSYIRLPEDG